jgi:hypothetical protein
VALTQSLRGSARNRLVADVARSTTRIEASAITSPTRCTCLRKTADPGFCGGRYLACPLGQEAGGEVAGPFRQWCATLMTSSQRSEHGLP